MKEHTTLLTTT